jgi:hypothetical protein
MNTSRCITAENPAFSPSPKDTPDQLPVAMFRHRYLVAADPHSHALASSTWSAVAPNASEYSSVSNVRQAVPVPGSDVRSPMRPEVDAGY